jgi:type II secretory ATPase GspE/PulE/Tfp pilus assembly ATPase PilB-like protein/CheY-like chemotaxis protein
MDHAQKSGAGEFTMGTVMGREKRPISTTSQTGRFEWLQSVAHELRPARAEIRVDAGASPVERWAAVCRAHDIGDAELAHLIASRSDLPIADFRRADPRALRLIPEKVARRFGIVPVREDDRTLTVATSDPGNLEIEEAVRFASGRQPRFEVASPTEILAVIESGYTPGRVIESLLDGLDAARADDVRVVDSHGPEAVDTRDVESGPVIRLTNLILRNAVKEGASDVHLEPSSQGGVVRFRTDGVLRPQMKMPVQALARVVSRIKIMANLDITDRLRPQDGRARMQVDDRVYDVRVSTVPTRESEKAVIRLLDPHATKSLKDLAFPGGELVRIRQLLGNRHGIVLVTGPTGSGKTTTIYAGITELASGEINIMSVEDPVEYDLPGVTQIQVEPKQGVTFTTALRAILRQDPDVIFVGEIRDQETAEMAVQAAMTGHLVLATLHTNDATGVVPRLRDIGLDAASIGATLRGVVAQRLVRRVCAFCSVRLDGDLTPAEKKLAEVYGVEPKVRALGCNQCGQTGYRGRFAVAEVLVSNAKVEEYILRGAGTAQLEQAAIGAGMRRMLDVALEKASQGETTLAEVERVLGEVRDDASSAALPAHVLIVDDDPVNRLLVRNLLQKYGFRVSEASDGYGALEELRKSDDLAVVVMDLAMPGMGGEELLSRMRSSIATAGIPVVVLTGSEDEGAEARLIDQGADDYVLKPLDPARFLARVKATLRRAGA